ncbi:TolC family protein [Clostridium beijerinckii]|jgi:hypothetical protein|uniref:Uncharacterized protein n=1 Tax=Clostridium beijerinckii (strain ATCC 51743 / NCIMB 8052) TaxID=290402 RepID=A6LQ25_CLOB8|nr:TolC family protein [Clostridium beijerinckii]ABR32455.1 hypothetical protein Cbei_0266 [Clostridium beijerinckii NCIMB 8052]AIU04790.1 hypothetical protein Cbs_0266 [Clostridium beijerinckii ATCC 35702]NRT26322.1 putative nucleic acid-binding Zn-ribbon protein [Clostridium beijerinckii]NRT66071.1 putative nucleic acid-binding Zn-ribbon protein [Clostridium beijerinckii]NRT82419.1 putative nucleic acid-binding Zn-ribbon protein [Clostridium beijerinckii]
MDTYDKVINGYTGVLSARLACLNSKSDVYKQLANLDQNKKQLKNQLKTLYTNLLTTEDSITTLKKNIDLNNKRLVMQNLNMTWR